MAKIIHKKQIKDWLKDLGSNYRVKDVRDDVLPPKRYFFKSREEILKYDKNKDKLKTPSIKKKPILLFGLDLLDLEALTQLDEIMSKPLPDYYYKRRRKNSVLVGISDETIEANLGGDLILMKVNDNEYKALPFSEKGEKLTRNGFFKKRNEFEENYYSSVSNPLKELLLDPELIKNAVAWSRDHKIWQRLGHECLGCGVCTYVCPLCHCFYTEDKVSLDQTECSRCRIWDACTLPRFAKIAGGHDFHPEIKDRYYNWFYHKFVRAYKEYGKAQCVACGRCFRYCPAGINILEILNEIVEDYKNEKSL